jgi:hemolysin activation/secretion protein
VSKPQFRLHLFSKLSLIGTILILTIPTIAVANPLDSPQIYAQIPPNLPGGFQRPAPQPIEPPQPILPPPDQILPTTPTPNLPNQAPPSNDFPVQITVKRFDIVGSTIFTPAELAKITIPVTNKPIDFAQLLQVASDITQLYTSKGYVNSGAYIPGSQSFDTQDGVVKIEIIEGRVEDIVVTGTQRLDPNYIKSRIALGANKPLKIDRLIESLRLLQLDPLIKSISTELVAGKDPGTSIVQLKIAENLTWRAGVSIANNRTPSIGDIQTQAYVSQSNLTGLGDGIGVSYGRSQASNALDFNYTLPLNPHNGTLKLQYSLSNSRVIEAPFDRLDINGTAQDFSLSYRQPLLQSSSEEFALGLTLGKKETNTGYLFAITGEKIGYPSPGADVNGITRITAARFFQDYTIRDTQQVFAARSQVSLGLNALGATITPSSPDGKFLTWRGQAQYVRALAPDSIFLFKVESQLADRPIVALEQLGFGGQDTVRGYRQDLVLGDSGIVASAEARFPIFTPPGSKQLLQIVPFVDFGVAWNKPPIASSRPNTLGSAGLGLRYQAGENFFAKLDYGIPFTSIDQVKRTVQEKGFYFSLGYNHSF